ncbi:hypothetical protein [Pseudomonas sp. Q11]|uniref:hypothetical protein n=1 Tax=Pseudomonas sp. Q11 TaxID=2968470 RepID=UPI00210E44BF|nr:hypothetical protein [Pseudomonas sp. Q11]MCQ6255543.1 hypothetical protein [Pseudomonas sp. Q11]
MKNIVEHQSCAMHPEKAEEPTHETESTSLPGTALSDSPVEHSIRAPERDRHEADGAASRCYEHRQGVAQTERSSGVSHTRPVCERGG